MNIESNKIEISTQPAMVGLQYVSSSFLSLKENIDNLISKLDEKEDFFLIELLKIKLNNTDVRINLSNKELKDTQKGLEQIVNNVIKDLYYTHEDDIDYNKTFIDYDDLNELINKIKKEVVTNEFIELKTIILKITKKINNFKK